MDREALADFLKRRRDALRPEELGLSPGGRRRTSGLRREEVADLAQMSTDFYARLEQQRGPRPSEQTVAALSSALRLSGAERDHLFALAGHNPPLRAVRTNRPSAGLLRIMELIKTPAMIVSDLYVTLSQNRQSRALHGELTRFQGLRRSLVYRWFTEPDSRSLLNPEDHDYHARNWVSSLRAVQGQCDDDPETLELVSRLLEESPEFAELWARHEVSSRPITTKRLIHPVLGPLTVDCQTLTSESLRERLVVFTALDSEGAAKLDLL